MAAATILYVGDDICHRIPVMESNGILVFRSECTVGGLRTSFAKGDLFSAITFHNDIAAPSDKVVSAARELCRAPLVLFRNYSIDCDDAAFDLVIPVPALPEVWSKTLAQAIRDSRKTHQYSRQLRADCVSVRERSRSLREIAARNQGSPVDYDALFRGDDTED
jgi:hypothetical protein